MGTRQVTIRFCDCCGKTIEGRLTLHTCPCCGKDICVECQEKEDTKHKPRERKSKSEQASMPSTVPKVKSKAKKQTSTEDNLEVAEKKGEYLTIHVPTGLEGDEEYTISIRDEGISGSSFNGQGNTLVEAVENCLNVRDGKIPEYLSDYERKLLQGILDAAEK